MCAGGCVMCIPKLCPDHILSVTASSSSNSSSSPPSTPSSADKNVIHSPEQRQIQPEELPIQFKTRSLAKTVPMLHPIAPE